MILPAEKSSSTGIDEYFRLPKTQAVRARFPVSEPLIRETVGEEHVWLPHVEETATPMKTVIWRNEHSFGRVTPFIYDQVRKAENIAKLQAIRELGNDWNGNGADSFSDKLIEKVFSVIHTIIKQPKLFPTARDSIQLEFEKENGDYLEFELFENKIDVFVSYADGREMEKSIPYDVREINRIIVDFYETRDRTGRKAV
ncbi:hypothetical protein GK107_15260 [Geobacillus thermoleovorans]|uniref:Uncharacterized protein n=2 Tax=Geobacillus TaxID=129337 RepID=A0A7U9P706_GEOTM|nr:MULTISPECIES: hypothetical protein [Geobacillus]AKM20389.1 hypothetical protein GARCT_03163 [Geobacillus sp. 12AMOR1]KDE46036.1 hypothetical protein DI43_17235 [Geobacillus sp. CAMR12739]WJQ10290.1 hypothetical protein QT237_16555 [Geobacillus stearothermophilus]STO13676.1 Uncharacterised protein [[Flavobacterium] thermophilum]AUI37198.1 hypothetical protein CWI35_12340 [[Bacillus] caldolyticus]